MDLDALGPGGQAIFAALLCAIDPCGVGGVVLHGPPSPTRDAWLAMLRQALPPGAPFRRVPLQVTDSRLYGGLDLAATLAAGRPVAERGLLAEADFGVLVLSMAERIDVRTAARIGAVLDEREVCLERDGLTRRSPARMAVIALDESIEADERVSMKLMDRLAFYVELEGLQAGDVTLSTQCMEYIQAGRARLGCVRSGRRIEGVLCETAQALGIDSLRALLLCHAAARAAAALAARDEITEADAILAARLVLAPRATMLPDSLEARDADDAGDAVREPAPTPPSDSKPEPVPSQETERVSSSPEEDAAAPTAFSEVVIQAALASIPKGLLAQLGSVRMPPRSSRTSGRAGLCSVSQKRGRPISVRAGELRDGTRLNLIETLRAAAPWQQIRRQDPGVPISAGVLVRRADFRIQRFKQRSPTTTIFVLDASGSAVLNRLAEAKGAVELLLNECYVRRDRVALISFRGRSAEILLPPTRSLARAKRNLSAMPGGGGTPLATGIGAAAELAGRVAREGQTPTIVLLTDGRANIARDGVADRQRAEAEALVAARELGRLGHRIVFLDTSTRPLPQARSLAQLMRAEYRSLPHAGARMLADAVKSAQVSKA